MRTIPTSAISVPIILTLAACGGGDAKDHGTINSANAATSVASVADVHAAMAAGDGEGAASAVMLLTATGQSVVTPSAPRVSMVAGLVPDRLPRTFEQALTGSATCTETMCTFVDFGDDTADASWRIDGTISYAGDVLAFDLTYDVSTAGFGFHWEIDGSIRITDTLIDGELHSSGSATGDATDGYDISWDIDVVYDAIGLDGAGCPVSGTLSASASYQASGSGGSQGYAVEGSVTFGPACGEYTLH